VHGANEFSNTWRGRPPARSPWATACARPAWKPSSRRCRPALRPP